jgi:xyloglucan-specific endo-beta-1,4-glucanase
MLTISSLWDVVHAGNYTLNANLWGASAGNSGSWQCIGLDWVNGNSIGWHTEWDWQGGPNSVKSYTNVAINMDPKQIWAINSIPTSWDWV